MVELLLGPISTTSFFPGVIKAVNQLRLLDRTTGYRVLSSSYRVFTVNPPPKKKTCNGIHGDDLASHARATFEPTCGALVSP